MSQITSRPNRKPPTTAPAAPVVHDTELIDEMDALLRDIDELLEDQEHLLRFRQRGGE